MSKYVSNGHENGPRRRLRGPFPLAALATPSADIHALYLATAHLPRRIRELVNHLAAGLNDRIDTYTDTTSNSNAQRRGLGQAPASAVRDSISAQGRGLQHS